MTVVSIVCIAGVFQYDPLLGFVTSINDHLVANRMCSAPVERDGVVGFMQLCTVFPPHIWCLYSLVFIQSVNFFNAV